MLEVAHALRGPCISHGTRVRSALGTPHAARSLKAASNPSKLRAQARGPGVPLAVVYGCTLHELRSCPQVLGLAGVKISKLWGWRTTGRLSRQTSAVLTTRDPGSGAEFPLVQTLWYVSVLIVECIVELLQLLRQPRLAIARVILQEWGSHALPGSSFNL